MLHSCKLALLGRLSAPQNVLLQLHLKFLLLLLLLLLQAGGVLEQRTGNAALARVLFKAALTVRG